MSDGFKIEKSWKTITLVPDFMNEVVNLLDYKETLQDIVRFCEIDNDDDRGLLLYALYGYAIKAYKAKSSREFILENEDKITNYFGELIAYYNELVKGSFNELHKHIWYLAIYMDVINEVNIDDKLDFITAHKLFDECELKHKSLMLNIHIQYLLEKEDADFDKLMALNEKLKALNILVRRMNGEDI